MAAQVRMVRVYEQASPGDGTRILVDRLWPRGLAKDEAAVDVWERSVAPSKQLRTWYGHDPEKFKEFRRRYLAELKDPERAEALDRIRAKVEAGTVTLLTATRDADHSQAAVLLRLLRDGH